MPRYIDFEIAREYLHKACEGLGSNGGLMLKIKFDEEPTEDVAPVVHGEWIHSEIIGELYNCSVCGGSCWYYDVDGYLGRSKYCPNCGAKMDLQ